MAKIIIFDSSGIDLNTEPGFVMMLNEKIVLSLGFRFQYVRLSVKNAEGLDETEGLNDYVYGEVPLSVVPV